MGNSHGVSPPETGCLYRSSAFLKRRKPFQSCVIRESLPAVTLREMREGLDGRAKARRKDFGFRRSASAQPTGTHLLCKNSIAEAFTRFSVQSCQQFQASPG